MRVDYTPTSIKKRYNYWRTIHSTKGSKVLVIVKNYALMPTYYPKNNCGDFLDKYLVHNIFRLIESND